MAARFGPGFLDSKCQFPQLTAGGLDDSHQHGLDLASVYRDLLGFLPSVANSEKIEFRVTNNVSLYSRMMFETMLIPFFFFKVL